MKESYKIDELKEHFPTIYDCVMDGNTEAMVGLCHLVQLRPVIYFLDENGRTYHIKQLCGNPEYKKLYNMIRDRNNLNDIKNEAFKYDWVLISEFYNLKYELKPAITRRYKL